MAAPADQAPKRVFQDIALAHREIYALYEIAQSMGTSLGVADTMALISSKLSSLVPFTTCALFLHEESGDLLRCRFATGMDAELLQPLAVKNGQGLVGWVGRNLRPLVNARPSADLEAGGVSAETTLQSALVCPLVFNDRLIGALAVYDTEPGRFTDDHRRLLDRVAEQAAGVVNNSIVFEQTKRDSLTDPLTGLPNTRFMFVHLTRELARAERLKTEVSLLVMDLDGFKEINDMHGHHVGDKALREVARVLRIGHPAVRHLRPLRRRRVRRRAVGLRRRRSAAEAARAAAGHRGHPVRGAARPLRPAGKLVRQRGLPARRRGVRDAAGDGRQADVSGQGAAQGAASRRSPPSRPTRPRRQAALGVC